MDIELCKHQIAVKNGFSSWAKAMLSTHRKKKQIQLYEELIILLVEGVKISELGEMNEIPEQELKIPEMRKKKDKENTQDKFSKIAKLIANKPRLTEEQKRIEEQRISNEVDEMILKYFSNSNDLGTEPTQ